MKRLFTILFFVCFANIINTAQNLVLHSTLNDAASITSPSTGPIGAQTGGDFTAVQYGNGFLSDTNNEFAEFNIGASTGSESGKLNQNKGTIALWYKPDYNSGSGTNEVLCSIGLFSDGFSTMILLLYTPSALILGVNGLDPARASDNFSSTSWAANDLVHIAAVWDASGSNTNINGGNSAAIYINGSVTASGNTTWTPVATLNNFYVGALSNETLNAGGAIDDIYVYDDVLTSAQINSLKDSQALPVELTSFSVNLFESSAKLNWATATEVNNYGFEIERQKTEVSSQNSGEKNSEWEKIGFVNGHGNSNSPKYYSFIDDNAPSGELKYRLKQIDFDGAFEYSDVVTINNSQNYEFDLEQNYPNPFNPTTTISFTIPSVVDANFASTTLKIYDVLGSEVATLVNEMKVPGNHKINFNSSNLTSGMYFYTLTSGSFRQTKKMLLIK